MTAKKRPRVLVVEDTELNRDLIEQLLEEEYALEFAGDGERAVELALTGRFDLVLMDISLPKLDGLSATRLIRDRIPATQLPVVAITAHAMRGDRERALDAGCDEYVTKPVDEELLLSTLARLTQR